MEFELASGRTVSLADLRMHRTCLGVLCGWQHPFTVHRLIEAAEKKARERLPAGANPVRLAHEGDLLPAVTCIGEFQSGELPRRGSEPYSSLVVIWFQEVFTPAVSANALEQIRALDWDRLAHDWNW